MMYEKNVRIKDRCSMDRILIRKVRKRIRGFRIRKSTLRFRNTAIYADAESLHFSD